MDIFCNMFRRVVKLPVKRYKMNHKHWKRNSFIKFQNKLEQYLIMLRCGSPYINERKHKIWNKIKMNWILFILFAYPFFFFSFFWSAAMIFTEQMEMLYTYVPYMPYNVEWNSRDFFLFVYEKSREKYINGIILKSSHTNTHRSGGGTHKRTQWIRMKNDAWGICLEC